MKFNTKQGAIESTFVFDFRYYNSFEGEKNTGGAYVFDTADLDSTPYKHDISCIETFLGANMDQYIIHYIDAIGKRSYAKVKVFKGEDPLKQV